MPVPGLWLRLSGWMDRKTVVVWGMWSWYCRELMVPSSSKKKQPFTQLWYHSWKDGGIIFREAPPPNQIYINK